MVSYRFHVVTCLVMDEISPTARTLDLVNNNIEIDLEDKLVSVPELLG